MEFADLKNRHLGEPMYIFGSGGSLDRFDFKELAHFPRILINNAANELPVHPDKSYWVYMDKPHTEWKSAPKSVEGWRDVPEGLWELTPRQLFTGKGVEDSITTDRTVHYEISTDEAVLGWDRDKTVLEGTIYYESGSIVPCISLAWLMGAYEVRLVGIDGDGTRAESMKKYYAENKGAIPNLTSRHKCTAEKVAQAKGLRIIYVNGERDEQEERDDREE